MYWYELGLELGLLCPTLQVIEDEQRGDVRKCTRKMLSGWLNQRDRVTDRGTPSWRRLVDALRKVREHTVADEMVRAAPWNK